MKVTPEHVNALIEHAQYHRFKNTTTTVCCITLKNGHTTVGYSACADPAEFNEQLGMKIAFNKARDEIYNLEAYMLSDALHRERKVTNAERAFNERSTEEAEQDELEWPDLNFGIEVESIDNFVFSISDEERTMMKWVIAMGGTVIRTDEGEQWKVVELCDEGAICEYAGEVDE